MLLSAYFVWRVMALYMLAVAYILVYVLLESFRALSPLKATSDNSTRYGDHSRQVEISPSSYVSSHLQQGFGDRGDACHMFEDAPHGIKSPQYVSSASFVGHVSEAGIPTLPTNSGLLAAKGSSSLDVGKPMQQHKENGSSPADQTLSDAATLSRTTRNVLPTSVPSMTSLSSTDDHLSWETLFMPYRRNHDVLQILQPVPVTVSKETRNQIPINLATLHEGFSETCIMRQYSEGDIARPDCADNTSVDNTSLWVMNVKCL